MATEAQLIEALRRADAAGNVNDARQLAQAIGAMRKGASAAPRGQAFITEAQSWEDTRTPAEMASASRDQGAARGYTVSDSGGGLLGEWGVPGFADARQRDAYVERQNRNAPGRLATAVQGATLGFGDEILGGAAGLGSMVGGGTFNEGYAPVRDAIRENAGRYASENPVSAVGITLASAAPTAIALTPRALMEAPSAFARLAGGTGVGAGVGAVAGFGEGEDGFQSRMDSANSGAWLGGMFGAGAEVLGSTLGPVVRRALNSRRVRVIDASGQPTQEAIQMAQEAGLDPAAVPPALWQRVQAIADRGGAPGVAGAADAIRAESLPVPVPMSRGQLTGDRAILANEYALARGADGGTGMNIMGDLRDRQQQALAANIPAIRERIAAGSPVVERGQGGGIIANDLAGRANAARQNVDALYNNARQAGEAVTVPGDVGTGVGQRMATRVATDHAVENIPKVAREIERLGGAGQDGPVSVRTIFETRARLSGIRSGGGEDAVAAGKAIRELDAAVNDALDLSLMSGDEAGVTAWRNAISANRAYADAFKSRDLIGRLVRRDPQRGFELSVDPREATNAIFGTSDLGFLNKRDMVRDLTKMRDMLGADSDAWNAVRQEAFNRIANQSRGAQEPGGTAFSGAKLAKAWEEANARNPEVLRLLFSAEERRDIGNFANVARRATTVDSAVRAPSTSPFQMNRIMENVAKRIPLVGSWLSEGLRNAKGAFAARQATSGRLYDVRNREPIPLNALVPGATQAASGP